MKYSRNFWALTTSVFLFMVSFNLIIPELNGFITSLGGENYKGLIIGLFTITAAISRPFSGKMADIVGRKSTMYVGTIVSVLITVLYPFSSTVLFFLMVRLFHGFSTGFLPTGATALITDILPEGKRGQGMGVYGTGMALGTGVGQFFGTPIATIFSINGLFVVSGISAIISILIIKSIKETLPNPQPFSIRIFKIKATDIIEIKVIPVAIVMFLTAVCSGIILVLTPDISVFLGIANKGWYYVFYVISTILMRLTTGHISDKIGRRETLIIGIVFLIIAMIMTGNAESVFWYTVASFVFGMGSGIISPALFAWMADLSPNHRRGISSATLFIALETGILFGSVSTLLFYDNTFSSLKNVFYFGAIITGISLLYVVLHLLYNKNNKTQ